jgi:proteasome lid subunit RPN8/RPN11
MGEAEFEIIEHAFDVPFRARNVHSGYVRFRADDLDVYVTPAVASRAREWARDALPRETGGLLAGRILRDDAGQYVVVTGIACAPEGAGGVGAFSLSPEETELLRRALSQHHPSADVIGWWHSHGAPSQYSSTDRSNQAIWTDPRHVGLLVFARGTPWAALYVGPQSRGPFQPSEPPQPSGPPQPSEPFQVLDRYGPQPPSRGNRGPRASGDPKARRRMALTALIAVMALAIIALLVKEFRPAAAHQSAVLPTVGSVALSGTGSLDWSCRISPHGATPLARCHAQPRGAVQSIKWYENKSGTVRASGPDARLYLQPGTNVVRIVITYSAHASPRDYQMILSVLQ